MRGSAWLWGRWPMGSHLPAGLHLTAARTALPLPAAALPWLSDSFGACSGSASAKGAPRQGYPQLWLLSPLRRPLGPSPQRVVASICPVQHSGVRLPPIPPRPPPLPPPGLTAGAFSGFSGAFCSLNSLFPVAARCQPAWSPARAVPGGSLRAGRAAAAPVSQLFPKWCPDTASVPSARLHPTQTPLSFFIVLLHV